MDDIYDSTEVLDETVLPPTVIKDVPAIQFMNTMGKTLPVSEVYLDDGKITSVKLTEEIDGKDEYTIDELFVNTEFLFVPGIGYLTSGTIVELNECDYILLFGWHTNPSNQTIYSWYLAKDNICHTLYREMIDEINTVKIQ